MEATSRLCVIVQNFEGGLEAAVKRRERSVSRGSVPRGQSLTTEIVKEKNSATPPRKKKCGIIYTHIYVCVYVYHKPTISETLIFGQL